MKTVNELKNCYFVAGSSIRQKVLGELKNKFATVTEAEDAMGITVESYVDGTPEGATNLPDELQQLHVSPALLRKMKTLSPSQIRDLVMEGLASLGGVADVLMVFFEKHEYLDVVDILDKLYNWAARKIGITSNPRTFVQFSMDAMKRLEDNSKPNLVLKFCQGLALDRPNNAGPLIPIHRMPLGLIQYCIEFFTCTNVMQVGVTIS